MLILAAAGTAAPLEEEPAAETPTQLSFEPEAYDFGLQQVYNSSETSLQLRNDGEAAAPVNSLDIVGPDAYAFWINGGATNCYARNLQPNETCSVQVGFNPNNAAQFSAQLRVSSEGGASFTADAARSAASTCSTRTAPGFSSARGELHPVGQLPAAQQRCEDCPPGPLRRPGRRHSGDADGRRHRGSERTRDHGSQRERFVPILQRPNRVKRHIRRHKSSRRLRAAVSKLRVSR